MVDEHADLVRDLLSGSGIHPGDEDLAVIVAGYPAAREMVDRLYAVPTEDRGPR